MKTNVFNFSNKIISNQNNNETSPTQYIQELIKILIQLKSFSIREYSFATRDQIRIKFYYSFTSHAFSVYGHFFHYFTSTDICRFIYKIIKYKIGLEREALFQIKRKVKKPEGGGHSINQ